MRRPSGSTRSAASTFGSMLAIASVVAACVSFDTSSRSHQPAESPAGPSGSKAAAVATIPLLVDTDVAGDDLAAIASLVRDPEVELVAITVSGTGEAHCPGGMFVVRSVVTMLRDDDIPVACGRAAPMGEAEAFPDAWRAAADAGNGLTLASPRYLPDARSAEQLIVDLAGDEAVAGRTLTILTTGTLTNLASALALDPTLPTKVHVVSMLGAIAAPGNVQTQGAASPAEWNAHADPTAVRRVIEAGFDWTLVPLDATNSTPLTSALYATLEQDHAAGPADLVFELWSRNAWMYEGGSYLWDPLAAAAVRDPGIVTTRAASLRVVEGAGIDGGRLIEDAGGSAVTVAVSADRSRFETAFLGWLRTGPARSDPFTVNGDMLVTAGPGTCGVQMTPPMPQVGLLRVAASSDGSGPHSIVVFQPGAVTWAEVEAFARAAPNGLASPPPVTTIGTIDLPEGGTGTFYADVASGQLGVACVAGSFDKPIVTLAGPFAVAG